MDRAGGEPLKTETSADFCVMISIFGGGSVDLDVWRKLTPLLKDQANDSC